MKTVVPAGYPNCREHRKWTNHPSVWSTIRPSDPVPSGRISLHVTLLPTGRDRACAPPLGAGAGRCQVPQIATFTGHGLRDVGRCGQVLPARAGFRLRACVVPARMIGSARLTPAVGKRIWTDLICKGTQSIGARNAKVAARLGVWSGADEFSGLAPDCTLWIIVRYGRS